MAKFVAPGASARTTRDSFAPQMAGAFPAVLRRMLEMKENDNILDQVQVASPCNARWEDMTGDDRARFCRHCQKHVFNLSAMTQIEAEALVRETEGRFCGRFHRRRDGKMLTADCPTGWRLRRSRVARWCGAACATLMVLIGGRTTLRSAETNPKNSARKGNPSASNSTTKGPMLLGEIALVPPIMGDICISTNVAPPPTNPPAIMGRIAIAPVTNAPALPDK